MKHFVVFTALLAAIGSVSAAEESTGQSACRADAEKLCKDVEPGKGRVAQCLKQHEAQVSSQCKAHMEKMHEAMQARMQAFSEACKADLDKHCKGVEPGGGRVTACLRKNESNLSASCKEQMAKVDQRREHAHARMQELAEACKADAKEYCAEVRPGGGRVAKCLQDNEAKLSAQCKAAMQPR